MHAITYLAPGIPIGFYELLVDRIGRAVGEPVALRSDPRASGPQPGEPNPLVDGDVDLAFVCGPSYASFAADVTLVPVAPVFDDPRADGRPAYFAEVVTRDADPAQSLVELRTARFAYNDPTSLSGRLAVLAHLQVMGFGPPSAIIASGSHEASLRLVQSGAADACAIDSVVWRRLAKEGSDALRGLRIVETLGPFPIQPIVAARRVPEAKVAAIARALRDVDAAALAPFGATGFAPVPPGDYRDLPVPVEPDVG